MAGRPDLQKGYLGPQAKFSEFGLSTVNYANPDLTVDTNKLEVKIKFTKPVKTTATLTQCSKNEELAQHVFTQTRGDVISFYASLPQSGFYKLSLFALPIPDDSKTLPGVFNYLINCQSVTCPVEVYPKQYAQWKEGCYINEPVSLCSSANLSNVKFQAYIPNVQSVAVVAEGEWNHLTKGSCDMWEGHVNLEQYKGKDSKVTLNANYGGDNKFSTLLEYRI